MTARERLTALGWTTAEPRSGYDAAIFKTIEALVDDGELLRSEITALRDELVYRGLLDTDYGTVGPS
jgi:hypothetical protein